MPRFQRCSISLLDDLYGLFPGLWKRLTKPRGDLSAEIVWLQDLIPHHVAFLAMHLHIIRGFITERILLDRFGNALAWRLFQRVLLTGMLAAGSTFKPPFCGRIKNRPVEAEAFGFVKRNLQLQHERTVH